MALIIDYRLESLQLANNMLCDGDFSNEDLFYIMEIIQEYKNYSDRYKQLTMDIQKERKDRKRNKLVSLYNAIEK